MGPPKKQSVGMQNMSLRLAWTCRFSRNCGAGKAGAEGGALPSNWNPFFQKKRPCDFVGQPPILLLFLLSFAQDLPEFLACKLAPLPPILLSIVVRAERQWREWAFFFW